MALATSTRPSRQQRQRQRQRQEEQEQQQQQQQQQRKSLRQNVRHLLHFISTCPQKAHTIGSGILRRGDTSTTRCSFSIHANTATSLFPGGDGDGDGDIDIQWRNQSPGPAAISPTTSATFLSPRATPTQTPNQTQTPHSLLPATSLSHFDLRSTYLRHAPPSQHAVVASVDHIYRDGASYHASVVTVASPSACRRSASTLRLKPSFAASACSSNFSTISLESLSTLFTDSCTSVSTTGSESERSRGSSLLEKHSPPPIPRNELPRKEGRHFIPQSQSSPSTPSPWDPLSVVKHFQSFCVLDTAVPGAPVTATSSELRYIFDIGEQFFLNNQECKEASMDLVVGSDAAGNQVTHLVLFSPLVSPSSGRSRFMLAALVDVTEFITEAASLPTLDAVSEDEWIGDEMVTPPPLSASTLDPWTSFPATATLQLSAEDLLGGCFISERSQHYPPHHATPPPPPRLERKVTDDIWLDLVATERRKPRPSGASSLSSSRHARSRNTAASNKSSATCSPPGLSPSSSTNASGSAASVDDILDQFVASLQSLYSDFFLLGKNALDDGVYEICNVSPKVYESKEYTNGHLSRTSGQVIEELSIHLARDRPFCQHGVRWGTQGEPKQLYCSPLYGQNSLTWLCFLVDEQLPPLW